MIVHPCLGCSLQNLPIEALRCPRCGEENFIPLNRPLSAPESHPEPINDKKNFFDTSTEQTGEAKAIPTGCNQHEEIEPMWKSINFHNEEHADGIDGTNFKVKWCEGAGENDFRYQNINWKHKQQMQNCSNNPATKNNAIPEIPHAYDQAYSFNVEENYVCDSASLNFSATVSAHGKDPQNRMNFSRQPQSNLENQLSIVVASGRHSRKELSQFINEDGNIDFVGCDKCLKEFWGEQLEFDARLQSRLDPKPYKCEKCLCSFRIPSRLKKHQVIHLEERPFECDQCDQAFKRRDVLKSHILIVHTKK